MLSPWSGLPQSPVPGAYRMNQVIQVLPECVIQQPPERPGVIIGPRQITGRLSSMQKPIDNGLDAVAKGMGLKLFAIRLSGRPLRREHSG